MYLLRCCVLQRPIDTKDKFNSMKRKNVAIFHRALLIRLSIVILNMPVNKLSLIIQKTPSFNCNYSSQYKLNLPLVKGRSRGERDFSSS